MGRDVNPWLLPSSNLLPELPTGRTQLEVTRKGSLLELTPAGHVGSRLSCQGDQARTEVASVSSCVTSCRKQGPHLSGFCNPSA